MTRVTFLPSSVMRSAIAEAWASCSGLASTLSCKRPFSLLKLGYLLTHYFVGSPCNRLRKTQVSLFLPWSIWKFLFRYTSGWSLSGWGRLGYLGFRRSCYCLPAVSSDLWDSCPDPGYSPPPLIILQAWVYFCLLSHPEFLMLFATSKEWLNTEQWTGNWCTLRDYRHIP